MSRSYGVKLLIVFVGVLAEVASRLCGRLRVAELSAEPFSFCFCVDRVSVCARIDDKGFRILPLGPEATLRIAFKDAGSAVKVFLGVVSIPKAFAQGWMWVEGPIEQAVAVTRFFERFEAVLFPYYPFRYLFRGKPSFSFRRVTLRVLLYASCLLVPFIMPLRWK